MKKGTDMATVKPIADVKAKSGGQIVVLARLNPVRSQYLMPLLSREAEKRGWRLAIRSGTILDFEPDFKIDGALVQDLPDSFQVKALQMRGCSLVRMGWFPHPSDHEMPAVLPDSNAWGSMAANFFHERGFRNVSYLQQAEPMIHAQSLFDVFREASEASGMVCHPLRFVQTPEEAEMANEDLAAHKMERFIKLIDPLPKPCGMLFLGPGAMARYVSWMVEHGVHVPEDIAALGCPGPAFVLEHHVPSLSSVDEDLKQYVIVACDLLESLMAGGRPPSGRIFIPPAGITERESTSVIGVKDAIVAKAVRYMWDNLERDLSVSDIAAKVGIGRRSLERRFQKHLGRGVNAEMVRRRLQIFSEKLCATNLSVEALALQSGFRTMSHLRKLFRQAYGMTPGHYRHQHCDRNGI